MTIITDNYEPRDFMTRQSTLKYIISKARTIKKSIVRVDKDTEYLTVRCPVSGEYLDVLGNPEDIEWIDEQLQIGGWYKSTNVS